MNESFLSSAINIPNDCGFYDMNYETQEENLESGTVFIDNMNFVMNSFSSNKYCKNIEGCEFRRMNQNARSNVGLIFSYDLAVEKLKDFFAA